MRVKTRLLTFALLSFCTFGKYATAGAEFHQECARYGQLAATIGMDRDRGMAMNAELAGFRAKGASPKMMRELTDLTDFIYNSPAGKFQTPEALAISMAADCSVRIDEARAKK